MSVIHPRTSAAPAGGAPGADVADGSATVVSRTGARALAVLRILFGLTFLWAFLDKLLALGFSTGRDAATGAVDRFSDAAWVNGGSPTAGFLGNAADGPFTGLYHAIAGSAWADALFMLGLLGIGVSLTLGVANRLGAASGVVLYVLMWTVVLPPETNPLLDDHILGAATLVVLGLLCAGDTWGLGSRLSRHHLVQRYPVLR